MLDADGSDPLGVGKPGPGKPALDQLREELDEDAQKRALESPQNRQPRLMDVLFRPRYAGV